jgi:hypothetical protein
MQASGECNIVLFNQFSKFSNILFITYKELCTVKNNHFFIDALTHYVYLYNVNDVTLKYMHELRAIPFRLRNRKSRTSM